MIERAVTLPDGRTLHSYDTGADRPFTVFWHHGTPNLGSPPAPLFELSRRLGVRWVSYDRPGYGGSTPLPDRDIASAAVHVEHLAEALRIDRFAVMGHSGGGPHALACAALLPERVLGVVCVAGPAPYGAEGLDWYAGMATSGVASLRAAVVGRAEKERHEAAGVEYDPEFTPQDWAALAGEWSWLGDVAGAASQQGRAGLIDDDLAYVAPWGCAPADIVAPTVLLHGTQDRVIPCSHSEWLARQIPSAQLRLGPGDGHISILASAPSALEWLRGCAAD